MGIDASDGVPIDLDDLGQTLAYNTDGTLQYIEVSYRGGTYRQTYTYTSGRLTNISAWVKQ